MNLLNFIPYLRNTNQIRDFLNTDYPGLDIDYVDIYFKEDIGMLSELLFINGESIDGEYEFEIDGIRDINFFPLDHLISIYEDYYKPEMTDEEIAHAIISYRINDA